MTATIDREAVLLGMLGAMPRQDARDVLRYLTRFLRAARGVLEAFALAEESRATPRQVMKETAIECLSNAAFAMHGCEHGRIAASMVVAFFDFSVFELAEAIGVFDMQANVRDAQRVCQRVKKSLRARPALTVAT